MKTRFNEIQKLTRWWLIWLVIIPIAGLPIMGIYKQLILGEKFGSNPMSDLGLIIFSILMFSIIGLFCIMKLTTKIDKTEIQINFFPLVKKRFKWSEIKKTEVVNYGFAGGWGLHYWPGYGIVYNVRGNKGLAIELFNGKKFLIGTQKEAELKRVVKRLALDNGLL